MMKKILSVCLLAFIFSAVSGVNVFARSINGDEKTPVVVKETATGREDLKTVFSAKNDSSNEIGKEKNTLAEYEKSKAQGRKFSTTTKVLIGVGIAAVVIGVVVIAASKGAEDAASF